MLADQPAVRDFVADALAHQKFIAHTDAAKAILQKAGANEKHQKQLISMTSENAASEFLAKCRDLRSWASGDAEVDKPKSDEAPPVTEKQRQEPRQRQPQPQPQRQQQQQQQQQQRVPQGRAQ